MQCVPKRLSLRFGRRRMDVLLFYMSQNGYNVLKLDLKDALKVLKLKKCKFLKMNDKIIL